MVCRHDDGILGYIAWNKNIGQLILRRQWPLRQNLELRIHNCRNVVNGSDLIVHSMSFLQALCVVLISVLRGAAQFAPRLLPDRVTCRKLKCVNWVTFSHRSSGSSVSKNLEFWKYVDQYENDWFYWSEARWRIIFLYAVCTNVPTQYPSLMSITLYTYYTSKTSL